MPGTIGPSVIRTIGHASIGRTGTIGPIGPHHRSAGQSTSSVGEYLGSAGTRRILC